MSDLPPGLKAFGERLEQAARDDVAGRAPARRRRGRRLLRNAGLPVAAALVAAAASAGAMRLAGGDGEPIQAERDSGLTQTAADDPAVVEASAIADPGGGPPWVVRAFTTPEGSACAHVGQLKDGVFGLVQLGRFRALPPSAPGTCASVNDRGPLFAVSRNAAVDLTFVFGLAPGADAVDIEYGDVRRRVRPVGLGAFVTIFDGSDPRKPEVVVRTRVGDRPYAQRL